MKITMLETRRGSEDGFTVKRFHEGETYEVADTLARSFIAKGWAVNHQPIDCTPLYEALADIAKGFGKP